MIAVCGLLADAMVKLMCARLNDLGYRYLFFDQLEFPGRCQLTWEVGPSGLHGSLMSGDLEVELSDFSGVYARYVTYRTKGETPATEDREKELVESEYQLALMQLLDWLPCTVVNRPKASTSNDSKVYQSFLARAVGLETPRTLVTTEPEEVRTFYEECGRAVIYKSLSGVRSVVRKLAEQDLEERLEAVRNCPTQFQEWVEGVDIRVHAVGSEIFATQIESDASDYRYAARDGASLSARAIELPDTVAGMCLQMAGSLGLDLAGIDLRRTPDGRYYCFEINPSPAFIFYERLAGQRISSAVARLLHGSARPA